KVYFRLFSSIFFNSQSIFKTLLYCRFKWFIFVSLPTDKKLSKEIVVAHVDKVVVGCLGFFTVIYK
ncbi:TPA: hypothetical protein ACGO71_002263, partial [Streptococcus suis]